MNQQWSERGPGKRGKSRFGGYEGHNYSGSNQGGGGGLLGPGPQMPMGSGDLIGPVAPGGPMGQMGPGPMGQMGPGPMGPGGMMGQNNMPPLNLENVPPLLPPMLPGFMDMGNSGPMLLETANTEIQEVNMEIANEGNDANNRPGGDNNGHGNEAHGNTRERRDREWSDRDRSRRRSPRSRDRYDKSDRTRRDRDGDRGRDDARGSRRRLDDADLLHEIQRGGREERRGRRGEQGAGVQGGGVMMAGQMGPGGMMYPGQNMFNNMMQPTHNMPIQNMGNMPMQNMANMMPGMMMGMYPQMNTMAGLIPNQTVFMMNSMLLPPTPGAEIPQRRERPLGCRTIFVGGLPEKIQEETIREIFYRFGKIDDLKPNRKGFCHVRFSDRASVEASFILSGYRFKYQDQMEAEATNLFIDYALNHEDQAEYEKERKPREPSPPPIEPFSVPGLTALADKIKSEEKFAEAAPTLTGWLERGECNKRNANTFYSLIQASNNQVRRLFTEKMVLDDELANMKTSLRDKFQGIITQFEHVAKILTAARHQRVWDHFSKQQRRNIETWQNMSVELDNMREEFNAFEDEEEKQPSKKMVSEEKYEELKRENANLAFELEGYKNEAHVAKDEAERKFEKFKAQFIAQQALSNKQPVYPPLPPTTCVPAAPPPPPEPSAAPAEPAAPAHLVPATEARLISVVTAFLLVHPRGASLDYIVSYLRSMMHVTQATVLDILQKYTDVFEKKSSGVGASIETRWAYVTFDNVKKEPL